MGGMKSFSSIWNISLGSLTTLINRTFMFTINGHMLLGILLFNIVESKDDFSSCSEEVSVSKDAFRFSMFS